MGYGSRPESAMKSGVQRTIPDTSIPMNASDSLAATAVGGVDLRGKWIFIVADVAGLEFRAGAAALSANGGLPLQERVPEEFFVDLDDSGEFRHTGTNGQVRILYDSRAK